MGGRGEGRRLQRAAWLWAGSEREGPGPKGGGCSIWLKPNGQNNRYTTHSTPHHHHHVNIHHHHHHQTANSGLHFLAVQPDPDSEELTGLWLLQDRTPPNV